MRSSGCSAVNMYEQLVLGGYHERTFVNRLELLASTSCRLMMQVPSGLYCGGARCRLCRKDYLWANESVIAAALRDSSGRMRRSLSRARRDYGAARPLAARACRSKLEWPPALTSIACESAEPSNFSNIFSAFNWKPELMRWPAGDDTNSTSISLPDAIILEGSRPLFAAAAAAACNIH